MSKQTVQTFDPNQAPLVSETQLKNRRSLDELIYKRSVTVGVQNSKKRVIRGEDVRIKRPEQFVRENRIDEGSHNKFKRRRSQAERRSKPDLPKNSIKNTVGLVVRIHAGRHSNAEIKAELKKYGLNKKYDAVFMNLTEETITSLKALDAYVAYGYLSSKAVDEMIHRRAFTNLTGSRAPLSDNNAVEEALGDKNIICLQDLSHEIYSIGENFEAAKNILCTFKLSAPVGAYEKNALKIHDNVEEKGGFIGDKIELFLNKIL